MRCFFVSFLLLTSSSFAREEKCVVSDKNNVFQNEITLKFNDDRYQLEGLSVQPMVRGEKDGDIKHYNYVEKIRDYQKGQTYRVFLRDRSDSSRPWFGLVDHFPGKGITYINLIFGQSAVGFCKKI